MRRGCDSHDVVVGGRGSVHMTRQRRSRASRIVAVGRHSRGMPHLVSSLLVTEDGHTEGGGGLGLHAGHDVLVDGHGKRDAAVA